MRVFFSVAALTLGALLIPRQSEAQIPILSIITGAVKKVIVAIDLEVQRLQTQTIFLQDAQKQIENTMEQLKLNDITDWVQRQKDLYSEYYQELWQIKAAISTYEKVRDIIKKQEQIVQEYNTAYNLLKNDPHFSPNEVSHMYNVYGGILDQSVKNISQLALVINAFVTQMSDGDRLRQIDAVGLSVDQNYSDLHLFTQQNIQTSLERAHDENDAATIKALYGID
jgi:hypothetical protein